MVSHSDVAEAWFLGDSLKGSNMYTDGVTVYSYGEHFPIATKINGVVLFNKDKYSSSTSKHQSYVYRKTDGNCYFCNTEEIKKAIQEQPKVIVLTKKQELTTINECLESIRKIYKTNSNKRFPMAKFKQIIVADFI